MMFFTQMFTSKRGPLAKIWLAAHWEKKLTKAHVFECNLETSIRDILSPKMKIGLRTSGHLLLGVVRIYSRKTKYLLADCSDALIKIKLAFRPGQTDMPVEGLEATARAITLVEDFTAFDTPLLLMLPLASDINVEHAPLNQCGSENITLKEDFGHPFLNFQDIGDELQSQANTLLDQSFDDLSAHRDGFGDEDNDFDILDFLTNSIDQTETQSFIQEELPSENKEGSPVQDDEPHMDVEPCFPEETVTETTLLTNDEDAFALEPVPVTPNSERRLGKRKRKLVVDQTKELSNDALREQISDYSDLVASLDMAPPTVQLMLWKESGGADKLFSKSSSTLVNPLIEKVFAKGVFQVKFYTIEEIEQMRRENQKAQGDISSLFTGDASAGDSSANTEVTHNTQLMAFDLMSDKETHSSILHEELSVDIAHPDLPSEDSMFVHPSNVEQRTQSTSVHTQSLLGSQDFEERRITRRAMQLLNILKHNHGAGDLAFSLLSLCRGNTRSQAAATFLSLLVLKKQQIVVLHQPGPYLDVSVAPGPEYYT